MKKLLLSALLVAATFSANAQGTVSFANIGGGVNAPFTLDGAPIGAGSGAVAQLQLADGTNVGDSAAFLANGLFSGGVRTIDGVAGGGSATLQVAVLDCAGAVLGVSIQVTVKLGGAGTPPSTPAALSGLSAVAAVSGGGAAVDPIPEPSTIALAILGGAALLLRRRK